MRLIDSFRPYYKFSAPNLSLLIVLFLFQMSRTKHADDILNINVGGKKYTVSWSLYKGFILFEVRRTDLLADPRSKLAEWFKPGTVKPIATDKVSFNRCFVWQEPLKGGNYYLDRDAKTFRHILAYLRLKKEKFVPSLALPSKPDDLAK